MWVAGGVVSLIGALCYAELATTYPHTGGDYHFLTRAFGRNVSFLYAWARATVINTGSIALLSFVFGDYLSRIVALGPHSTALWAAIIVVALTIVNLVSLEASARTQNWLTVAEVAGLVPVFVAGRRRAAVGSHAVLRVEPAARPHGSRAWCSCSSPTADGTRPLTFRPSARRASRDRGHARREHRDHHRSVRRDECGAASRAWLRDLAKSKAAPADLVTRAFGGWGQVLAGFVAIATLTSINATMLVGARTNYALSRRLGVASHPRRLERGARRARARASRCKARSRSRSSLRRRAEGRLRGDGRIHRARVLGIPDARRHRAARSARRDRERARPFRVPLYPVTPAIFVVVCAYLCYSSIGYAMSRSAIHVSLLVMLVGVAAWAIARVARRPRRS